MSNKPLRAAAMVCALLASTTLSSTTHAQGVNPPPRQDTQSPTGVSFRSGAFSHNARDLTIGGGAFPQGLTLERTYLSSMDGSLSVMSGLRTQGWSHNFMARVGNSIISQSPVEVPPGTEEYLYSVIVGGRSVGFLGGSTNPTGGFVGSYTPAQIGGESLVFTGQHSTGTFTFTDSDGSVITFNPMASGHGWLRPSGWTAPDGTHLSFAYDSDGLRSVISNRGYALLFEFGNVAGGRAVTKACAVNMAVHYITATSACPAGVQAATYGYSSSTAGPRLTSATDATGQTTTFGYNARGHIDCITLPGQSSCQISNSYGTCTRLPEEQFDPPGLAWQDPVRSQTTATGETYSYSFPATPQCPVQPGGATVTMTAQSSAVTSVTTDTAGLPVTLTDPIGRTRTMEYTGATNNLGESTLLTSLTHPEGNKELYSYDGRGNLTERRLRAVAGSGLADIVSTAIFPATCTNPRTCNQPISVTDARLNTTTFTYDSNHGGVLTETGPAVGGIQPQTRHEYAQRYAWIKNSGGGYSQAATPIWVRVASSLCRNSAATGNPLAPCATPGDEVRTAYDYGPNSGPNTLLLRGQTVTSTDGGVTTTLRTCYAYDQDGRRISETQPNGTTALSSCP